MTLGTTNPPVSTCHAINPGNWDELPVTFSKIYLYQYLIHMQYLTYRLGLSRRTNVLSGKLPSSFPHESQQVTEKIVCAIFSINRSNLLIYIKHVPGNQIPSPSVYNFQLLHFYFSTYACINFLMR